MGFDIKVFLENKNTIFDIDLYGPLRNKVLEIYFIFYKDREVNASQIANKLQIDSNKAFKYLLILESEGKLEKIEKRE